MTLPLFLRKAVSVFASVFVASLALPGLAQQEDFSVNSWISTEFHPKDSQWYTNPWPEAQIPHKLDAQPALLLTQLGSTSGTQITIDPAIKYQNIVGIGSSLEHTTVYAIRKNKTPAHLPLAHLRSHKNNLLPKNDDPSTFSLNQGNSQKASSMNDLLLFALFHSAPLSVAPTPTNVRDLYSLHLSKFLFQTLGMFA